MGILIELREREESGQIKQAEAEPGDAKEAVVPVAGHPSPSEAVPPAQDKTASIDAVRKQTPSKAVPLIVAAMRTHDDDWVPLSVIGSHVRAANPEFDPRTYGCAKLVDLLEKTGQFQVKRNEIPVRARMKRLQ